MKFKLRGIMWELRLALRRVESVKNDIIVKDINDIYTYLAEDHKVDEETVKKEIGFDCKHFNGEGG